MKRDEKGEWYVNAGLITLEAASLYGLIISGPWVKAGTFERACLMMGGHHT